MTTDNLCPIFKLPLASIDWSGLTIHMEIFNFKSAYKLETKNDSVSFEEEWICRIKFIPRIQFFVSKCLHNSIRVNSCLVARGVTTDTLCPLLYI